jgi:hypothetical protein
LKTLYQTVEDRTNPDVIAENAPFVCNADNAWLGDGYYFWDSFIELAHWWGSMKYKKNYVICSFKCDFDSSLCFDLVGETEHMKQFSESIDFLKQQNLVDENTTVSRIISFLRDKVGGFNYEAVRAHGIGSVSDTSPKVKKFRHRMVFEFGGRQYLDYKPAIQICIYKKNGLNLRNGRIEYPDKYIKEFVI